LDQDSLRLLQSRLVNGEINEQEYNHLLEILRNSSPKSKSRKEPIPHTGVEFLIPINRTGWSIAAGYMGLFSILPFFGFISIFISGVAFYDFKRHPERHGRGRAVFGLVMGILSTLFYAIVLYSKISR